MPLEGGRNNAGFAEVIMEEILEIVIEKRVNEKRAIRTCEGSSIVLSREGQVGRRAQHCQEY